MLLIETFCLHAQELTMSTTSKGKVGYRNVAGKVVIKESYDYGEPFAPNGLAKVGKGKKFGLIDKAGKQNDGKCNVKTPYGSTVGTKSWGEGMYLISK